MTHRIVFVEDDADLAELISDFLSRHEMEVVIEPRGDTALDTIAREAPDLVLLDIMLPGKDGLSICRELRPKFDGPIIMLTSLDSDMNQILGLELGANDYILKTTPPSVLVARLRAQLRNLRPAQAAEALPAKGSRKAVFGQLSIDPVSRDVVLCGEKIPLSTSDFDLLWLLASHAGETLNRDLLLKEMRGVDYDGLDRSIDVAISRLRKKLGDNPSEPFRIKTVRNRGYLFSLSGWE
ncbi:two-component system response regulator RstA [Chromobacterium violaceum]|uniref:DNA-binding response regulator n=2 Tax=Chromobacterium violaceum TaxID=536 RepID=A0A1R0MAC0_CHRVL|nr:two-component system response regulator RstA [Chromobacterium violaceum]AAQ61505.1 probable two-component response regulator [Chromobacterium violaceum ATCC 12472]ATP30106.1 two-component system response regulator RstA [Chromobacterium violaceum]ATP34012.1 two-component system response regulator RstA [Chromobacterium violaceum]KJH66099.1 transcriptional regulator [Chromobacterium violaceum]MBA8734746.1 two-component system response regulator RstA [Chromobacterium violaceum]